MAAKPLGRTRDNPKSRKILPLPAGVPPIEEIAQKARYTGSTHHRTMPDKHGRFSDKQARKDKMPERPSAKSRSGSGVAVNRPFFFANSENSPREANSPASFGTGMAKRYSKQGLPTGCRENTTVTP